MKAVDLRQNVLDYINNKADSRFLRLVNALAKTYQEEETTERISIEQYNKEVDEAIARVENGEFYTQEEAEKIMDKW